MIAALNGKRILQRALLILVFIKDRPATLPMDEYGGKQNHTRSKGLLGKVSLCTAFTLTFCNQIEFFSKRLSFLLTNVR